MQWSKLKHTLQSGFAPALAARVQLHTTRYTTGSHFMARGWITLDGQEIANFSPSEHAQRYGYYAPEIDQRVPTQERTPGKEVERGEFDRSEFHDACWEYLSLSIDNALAHPSPIVQALAMLDKRLGKRRLLRLAEQEFHPLVKKLLHLRISAEGLRIPPNE